MVKFGKSKLKALNKLAKKQEATPANVSNKILKKKQNVEKKVTFQKEVLLKEAVSSGNSLVKNVSVKQILLDDQSKKKKKKVPQDSTPKPKVKAVEKHKKRQKTQINDTKLLLNLMRKKRN